MHAFYISDSNSENYSYISSTLLAVNFIFCMLFKSKNEFVQTNTTMLYSAMTDRLWPLLELRLVTAGQEKKISDTSIKEFSYLRDEK